MSAIERTPYRRPLVDEPRRDLHHAPFASGPSTDSIPSFLSDLQDQPDPREFEPLEASQWTSILARIVAGGLVILAFAILVALSNSDVARDLIDKARVSIGGATRDQSATQAASNQPAARQMLLNDDPGRASDPGTRASVNASAPRLGTASREDIVSDYRAAQVPAAHTGNEGAAPSKTLDAETLAALMTRAKSLLALGDIAAARLLLERAANAQDATAAFLLARTYDPAVLRVRDTRSITPDPVMARDWYRKAASFGSAEAQQRLTQLQN
jgi:hypothetical protein